MIDKAVVTLKCSDGSILGDFELPANCVTTELETVLASALAEEFPEKFTGAERVYLSGNGKNLSGNETLASRGLWDGSILEVWR
ncbi:MAG: EsaB/YukD family protein [Lachnospiraceae bacterium]|nr:EsaB/YukD family protein [Lachnospiraceae bacterium]